MIEYKGVKVEVSEAGNFLAVVKGEHVSKSSMAAMKKLIDKAEEFALFEVYVEGSYGIRDAKVQSVIAVRKSKGRYNVHSHEFVLADNAVRVRVAMTDQAGAILAYQDLKLQHEAIRKAQDEELRVFGAKIKWLTADQYVASKTEVAK